VRQDAQIGLLRFGQQPADHGGLGPDAAYAIAAIAGEIVDPGVDQRVDLGVGRRRAEDRPVGLAGRLDEAERSVFKRLAMIGPNFLIQRMIIS
jgi:hypothetical protein